MQPRGIVAAKEHRKLALQRKVTSQTGSNSADVYADFPHSSHGRLAMADLGPVVVVSNIADTPCLLFQNTASIKGSQQRGFEPGCQSVANLIEGQAFHRVGETIVVGIPLGKKGEPAVHALRGQSALGEPCSDRDG